MAHFPALPAERAELSLAEKLERGIVARYRRCPFPLPPEDDLEFLRRDVPRLLKRKNISYHPETGAVHGIKADARAPRVREILRSHSRQVERFLAGTAPELTRGWRVATCSFRPMEERGRGLKPHASNELIHVDAGAYGATHGDRILRFFVNVNPDEDRVWLTKGNFPELLNKHGRAAGLTPERFPRGLEEGPAARLFTKGLQRLARAGVPLDRVLDGSPYDRAMRRFHNYMKDTPAFRNDAEGVVKLAFEPYSAWSVFTDMVSHACVSGRYALVSTFIVPKDNCRFGRLVPYNVLQGVLRR